jgi:hypothetical protein
VDSKVDTLLTSLFATLVAYGGNSPRKNPRDLIRVPGFEDLVATLTLLGRLTLPLERAGELSPEEATRAIHAAMDDASHDTVRSLLSGTMQYMPQDFELPQPYILRLSENLIFEYLAAEFATCTLTPVGVRPAFDGLGDILVAAGTQNLPNAANHHSSLAATWAADLYRDKLVTRFWLELPPREKSAGLRGPDSWSVPIVALRNTLGNLAAAGADSTRREARNILLNFARRLDHQDSRARRAVAAGLNEFYPIIESLWPNQLPADLSSGALATLERETDPQISTPLAVFLESLSRVAVARGDFAGFETLLLALEKSPRDAEHEQLMILTRRLVAPDRWILLVDAALANRSSDPALARLLQREPDRLLDRLTSLLAEPRGPEMLPAMSRLLRTVGAPALNALELRLQEARPHRVTPAIKLLAAVDPDRLLSGFTRAIVGWEWSIQDLAVSELSRPANASSAKAAAFIFSTVLPVAHPLVIPMMIDHIGLAGEIAAIPDLMEIAAGQHEKLRDQFVRIKAIEALGRLHATESAELLHALAEHRDGLTFAEPSGLRAAANDALAIIEDRLTSPEVRAIFDSPAQNSAPYNVQRRYSRIPLESPLRAQVSGAQASLARVKTISLGGAYLESPQKFAVGDSLQLEVRSGLRKIHCTAVVRNVAPDGGGVEFVHMKDGDRSKLRKLVLRKLPPKP